MHGRWLPVAVALAYAMSAEAASYTRGHIKVDLSAPKTEYHLNNWPDRADAAFFDPKSRYGWYLKNGLEHMKRDLREASVEFLVHAAGLQPFQPYVRRSLGHAFFMVGEYKAAVDQFLRMIHLSHNPYRLEIDFEDYYADLTLYDRDLAKLEEAVRCHPKDAEAAFLYGLYLYYDKNYKKARPYLEAAVAASGGNPDYATFLRYCRRQGRRKS